MGSLLKALSVTIWGTIAVGLLLTIVLLGYRAVVKYRDLSAARSATGNLDVALGEIYYGLGDYLNAIAAIQRGLGKGQVRHLDDAYVYLGRSQVAVGNNAEARLAFAKLKEVPDISPRILRLWELYAETLK
jgi:tetratricopeptide (TPR) repeat protein